MAQVMLASRPSRLSGAPAAIAGVAFVVGTTRIPPSIRCGCVPICRSNPGFASQPARLAPGWRESGPGRSVLPEAQERERVAHAGLHHGLPGSPWMYRRSNAAGFLPRVAQRRPRRLRRRCSSGSSSVSWALFVKIWMTPEEASMMRSVPTVGAGNGGGIGGAEKLQHIVAIMNSRTASVPRSQRLPHRRSRSGSGRLSSDLHVFAPRRESYLF